MIEVRRMFTQQEEIFHEFGPPPAEPARRAAVMAVLRNPFAGRYEPDLAPFMQALNPLGVAMARQLVQVLGVPLSQVESYGKAAIVGTDGEIEHGAIWHVPGGYAMREVLGWKGEQAQGADAGRAGQPGNALAIVPATKKVGGPGTRIDVPLTHINASYVRSHYDSMELGVPGAPRADELVYILVMSKGGRIHERLGGLRADAIARWDGLR